MLHGATKRLVSTSCYLRPSVLSLRSRFCHSLSFSTGYGQFIPSRFFIAHEGLLDYFDHLLQRSSSFQHPKQVHTQIILRGCYRSAFLAARLISIYSQFGLISDARRVFRTTPCGCKSNLLLWNSILRANLRHGNHEETVRLYIGMKNDGVVADGFTLPLVVRACASIGGPKLCTCMHSHVLQTGLQNHLHVVNELLGMYAKVGRMDIAGKLFDRMPVRSQISWNTMISGFSRSCDCVGALEMFKRMELEGFEPNIVTWTSLLSSHARCGCDGKTLELFGSMRGRGIEVNAESLAVVLSACADLAAFAEGKMIHGYVVKSGFEELIVTNSLICLYGKHGDIECAKNLFLEMEMKDIVSWNSLITAYAESGFCEEASEIFSQLQKFDQCITMRPNVVTWSVIIDGFASKGCGKEALEQFRRMRLANVMANSVTVSSVLSVCAGLGAPLLGRELHAHAVRALMDSNILVGNGLINMYTKCGSLKKGCLVFENMNHHDLISWNSMIAGYGMHGYGDNALETFEQMVKEGFQPDAVTFIALLSACAHAGYVAEGRKLFNKMSEVFGIQPEMEHYACMVDLLSRSGLIEEASKMVKNMPMEPNAFVWGALLNSSRVHKNAEVAEETASHIFRLDSEAAGSYMLLSNIYAARGRWEDAAKVRLSAKTNGIKKTPGHSWIEVKNKVYTFSSAKVPKDLEEIYRILKDLTHRMESEGYKPDKSFVLQDVNEDEKKQILLGHSEKLAIAFGHAKLPPTMPIRIMKNLRVCGDCHSWTKYFSKITGREIIVRDARRFHHFLDGFCSCKDYW
ncbi:hypothetical protein Ancab_012510 [Ancistrocladus abbreviatus]